MGWDPLGQLRNTVTGAVRTNPIVRMAGSNPVVQGVVKLYQKIPTSLNPVKTRTPTTRIGQVGKALNPLNPVNIIRALPVGKTNKGETIRIGDFVYLDPVDLLNVS